jgi:hypothetical protein
MDVLVFRCKKELLVEIVVVQLVPNFALTRAGTGQVPDIFWLDTFQN